MNHPINFIKKRILKIRMYTLPMHLKVYIPSFTIENNGNNYNFGKKKAVVEGEDFNAVADYNLDKGFMVEGDVQIVFKNYKIFF